MFGVWTFRTPHILQAEVNPTALLREPHPAAAGHPDLMGLDTGSEWEWKLGVSAAQAQRPVKGTLDAGGVLRPGGQLQGVVGPDTPLSENVTVRRRPGSIDGVGGKVQLSTGDPMQSQPKGVRKIDLAYPQGVAIYVQMPV